MSTPLAGTPEIEKPDVGGDTGAWGGQLNAFMDAWDRHLSGRLDMDVTTGNFTLTNAQAQNQRLTATGSPASERSLIFPVRTRMFLVRNTSNQILSLYVTGFAFNKLYVPDNCSMLVQTSTSGFVRAASPPVLTGGEFPDSTIHPGQTYFGPGMFFSDRIAGFSRRGAGVVAVGLHAGGDSVRFQDGNSADAPLIGFGSDYQTGFFNRGNAAAWTKQGVEGGRLGTGLVVGTPATGELGAGHCNISGFYYRNGVPLPLQTLFIRRDLPVAGGNAGFYPHGLTVAPTKVDGMLRCIASNNGFSTGMITNFDPGQVNLAADATNAYYRVASSGITMPNLGTGVSFQVLATQWVLDLMAFF